MGSDRSGAEMRLRQADRQLDLDEGRRRPVPRPCAAVHELRRGCGGHGLRRDGAGGYERPQGRNLRSRLRPADRHRLSGRGHHLRSQHLRRCHGDRGARPLRPGFHRGDARRSRHAVLMRRSAAACRTCQLQFSRQRDRAPCHALGVPLPRHPRRAGHGDRQRRATRHLRCRSTRRCARRARM